MASDGFRIVRLSLGVLSALLVIAPSASKATSVPEFHLFPATQTKKGLDVEIVGPKGGQVRVTAQVRSKERRPPKILRGASAAYTGGFPKLTVMLAYTKNAHKVIKEMGRVKVTLEGTLTPSDGSAPIYTTSWAILRP
jgi:hypothetical protein